MVLIDEVHLLGESERGSALEAGVVSRVKMVSRFVEMREVGHKMDVMSQEVIDGRVET